MADYFDLELVKLSKNLLPYNQETFERFIKQLCIDFDDYESIVQTMVNEVSLTVFADITQNQLIEAAILAACQNIQDNIDFDKLASRLVVIRIYQNALQANDSYSFSEIYKESFKDYIHNAVELKLLNPVLIENFDLDELGSYLKPERDDLYDYIGIDTAFKRYMVKERENEDKSLETPQFMWMRIAMGLSYKEEDPVSAAKKFYDKYSTLECIPGGSTNIGSGTTFSALSNCYLLDTEDDIHSIFDNVKNVALISKATGGIGLAVTKLRAAGSPVRSNNTFSTGPIPFIKVMDAALKSVSRAGKKAGAMAIYMENWHIDFPDFLDLRQNAGDDYRRIRTADTAVYISDEFMKRVITGEDWYMFDPLEVPELTELYGYEFSKKYKEYIDKAKRGEMRMFNVIPAREQFKKMLTTLQSTSHPWLTWKDTINLRALNNNTGTIHSSNLCTEVCLPQDRDNIAVCNLFTVNLAKHIRVEGTGPDSKIDWEKLEDSVRTGIRHLDNLIDVNFLYVKESENSDKRNRAVGLGIMGFSEILEHLNYAYDSKESFDLIDRIIEFISYNCIDESANLASERGSYPNFEGSMWSKGYVPYDTITKVANDRFGKSMEESSESAATANPVAQSLELIKNKIQQGAQNAQNEETKELYQLVNQLTELITPKNVSIKTENNENKDLLKPGEGIELTQNKEIRLDWDKIREKVKKGMRNATVMMTAPNASIGLLAGTTPGMDPRFAQMFSRATSRGKFLDINKNLVNKLKELGLWEKVKGQVLEYYGDISRISEIPEEIKNVYKTSFQISPYAYIEVASRAQKWIDQAISRNMYLDTRDIDEMMDIYIDAWRRGVKTTYYLHVKPRNTAEQSMVKINKTQSMNKKGFGANTSVANVESVTATSFAQVSATTQMSLEGKSKDKKGFGFASAAAEEETNKKDIEKSEPVTAGVGFGKVLVDSDTKQDKANFKPEKKQMNHTACPLDPAERAQCLACQ